MLKNIELIDIFEGDSVLMLKKINEIIARMDLLTEYTRLENTQQLKELEYVRVRELRTLLGIKTGT